MSISEYCPLTAIRFFRAAVRENSFTRAAEHLGVTQSAVSQRIKQIEKHIGTPLFLRQKRKIVLTEEGRFLYEVSGQSLDAIEQSLNSIISGNIAQRIVLGVLSSFAAKWLLPRLGGFWRQHPTTELIIRSVNHTIDIERENAEIAVVNLPAAPQSPSLRWELLWREELFAVCSPAYLKSAQTPLRTPADLCRHTLLHDETEIASNRNFDWGSWLRQVAPEVSVDLGRGHFFTQSELTLQAAVAGYGVALTRASLAEDELRRGVLLDPLGRRIKAKSGCYVCSLKSAWNIPKIKLLRHWLRSEANITKSQ